MKLFLTSYRIPDIDRFKEFIEFTEDMKIAIVPNAKDYYADRARTFKINTMIELFTEYGFKNISVLDLNNHANSKSVDAELTKHDAIWVSGGNTFCLREAMKKSGFDQVIQKHVDTGLLFMGDSAGALIPGPSIEGIEECDEPAFAGEYITEGLGIIPEYVLPHVGNPEFDPGLDTARELAKSQGLPIIEITDDQMILYDNDSYEIV